MELTDTLKELKDTVKGKALALVVVSLFTLGGYGLRTVVDQRVELLIEKGVTPMMQDTARTLEKVEKKQDEYGKDISVIKTDIEYIKEGQMRIELAVRQLLERELERAEGAMFKPTNTASNDTE
jgi:hypothetical protein